MPSTSLVIAPCGGRYIADRLDDGWLVTCRSTGITSHAGRLEDGLSAAALTAPDEAWVRAAANAVRQGATHAGGRLHPLDVAAPPMLAAALGYVRGARLIACFFDHAGDEAVLTDGTILTSAEWRTWLLLHAHPHTEEAMEDVALGSPHGRAQEWLLIDRLKCSMATGAPGWIHAILRAQRTRGPVIRPDHHDDASAPVAGAVREGRTEAARVERCIRAFARWLDREHARRIDATISNGITTRHDGVGIES